MIPHDPVCKISPQKNKNSIGIFRLFCIILILYLGANNLVLLGAGAARMEVKYNLCFIKNKENK
jgi:hypothetical protein